MASLRPQEDAWKTLSSTLSNLYSKGLTNEWEEVHHEYEASHTVLALPSYRFEEKNHWLDYYNNWRLTKGHEIVESAPEASGTPFVNTICTEGKQDFGKTKITVVAESDLSDPDLNRAVTGHLVNESALCPAAVYAEAAWDEGGSHGSEECRSHLKIRIPVVQWLSEFEIDPWIIDDISHLSGFVLNGSGTADTKKQVNVSHGWDHLQIAEPLSNSKSYRNDVKMQE